MTMAPAAALPLLAHFPGLADIPRVELGDYPTPVAPVSPRAPDLWIKRDDLSATPIGGNKVRALEFLLGGVQPGDDVVTVGSAGSTHALAVATYARRLGARAYVGRWRQEMNATAIDVADQVTRAADEAPIFRGVVGAYAYAWRKRVHGARWIAAGGSTPLGVLGHVNAGLELVRQIEAALIPPPRYVVVPLGTGGTAAGLALAFAIARRRTVVIGARVVPRIVARAAHVRRLAARTAALIERTSGERVPHVADAGFRVAHEVYGGAYGRETSAAADAAAWMSDAMHLSLDLTYSAKAFALALRLAMEAPTLFWLTFDPRIVAATRAGVRQPTITHRP
jgi:D-cysteine desulfhydrase